MNPGRELTVEARQQIVDLIHEYCFAVDNGDAQAVARLFIEECEVTFAAGADGTVSGRAALERRVRSVLGGFSATSHHVSNIRLADATPGVIEGITYLYAWHRFADERPDGFLWGRYHDRFVERDGDWRIQQRILRITGESGFPMAWLPPEPIRRDPLQSASQPPSTTANDPVT